MSLVLPRPPPPIFLYRSPFVAAPSSSVLQIQLSHIPSRDDCPRVCRRHTNSTGWMIGDGSEVKIRNGPRFISPGTLRRVKTGLKQALKLKRGWLTVWRLDGLSDCGLLVDDALFMQSTAHMNASPQRFSVDFGTPGSADVIGASIRAAFYSVSAIAISLSTAPFKAGTFALVNLHVVFQLLPLLLHPQETIRRHTRRNFCDEWDTRR